MFDNAHYSLNYAFLVPNPKGKWVVTDIYNLDDPFRLRVQDGSHYQYGWLMPDGRISLINLEPKSWYKKRLDCLIAEKSATWRVVGRYPFYLAISPKNERRVVFIDHDASFRFEYVDFEARVFQRFTDNRLAREAKERLREAAEFKKDQEKRFKRSSCFIVYKDMDDGQCEWRVYALPRRQIGHGLSPHRLIAETLANQVIWAHENREA